MKVERREEEVWIIRNKKKGLRLKEKPTLESGSCAECYLYRRNYGKCLRTISRAWICDDSSIFVKVYED
jgi:hypothetical protein